MQQELSDISTQIQPDNTQHTQHSQQHGLQRNNPNGPAHHLSLRQPSSSMSPHSAGGDSSAGINSEGVNPDSLQERLRRLNNVSNEQNSTRTVTLGQRISEYESALTPAVPRQPLGFKVIKRADGQSGSVQLADFPNGMRSYCPDPPYQLYAV